MGIRGRGFYWLDALCIPQLTVSNHQAYGLQIARCSNHQRLRNLRGPTGTTGWLNKSQLRVHKCKLKTTAKDLRAMVKNYKAFNQGCSAHFSNILADHVNGGGLLELEEFLPGCYLFRISNSGLLFSHDRTSQQLLC